MKMQDNDPGVHTVPLDLQRTFAWSLNKALMENDSRPAHHTGRLSLQEQIMRALSQYFTHLNLLAFAYLWAALPFLP